MGQAANHCHTPPLALLPAYTPRPEKMQQDSDQVTVSLLRSGFVPFFQLRDPAQGHDEPTTRTSSRHEPIQENQSESSKREPMRWSQTASLWAQTEGSSFYWKLHSHLNHRL